LFGELLRIENLDLNLDKHADFVDPFELALSEGITSTYMENSAGASVHLFLQRVLYKIYRMKLFWYDDLRQYTNERSIYLETVRDRIEEPWQRWEQARLDIDAFATVDPLTALIERAGEDIDPEISADGLYFRDQAGEAGYRRLLAIASLDGLVEASQISRTLGGPGNEIQAVMTRLLVEEYGFGRLNQKHSSFFATMLSELRMNTRPEAYFEMVPWEVLAIINHSFLLSERKRWFLRYVGGLLYIELAMPAMYAPYSAAADRLGLSDEARIYWDLHIKVDIAHGRWMLDDVALPLAQRYPDDAWELVLGYDQQRSMRARAGAAITAAVREADALAMLKN
jgi:hypothetical protein